MSKKILFSFIFSFFVFFGFSSDVFAYVDRDIIDLSPSNITYYGSYRPAFQFYWDGTLYDKCFISATDTHYSVFEGTSNIECMRAFPNRTTFASAVFSGGINTSHSMIVGGNYDNTNYVYNYVAPVVSGCMDLNANNYNPLATENDNSCTYDPIIPPFNAGNSDNFITEPLILFVASIKTLLVTLLTFVLVYVLVPLLLVALFIKLLRQYVFR